VIPLEHPTPAGEPAAADPGREAGREGAPTPAWLEAHVEAVLKAEGEGTAKVTRHRVGGRLVVYKRWVPSGSRLLAFWARHCMRREIAHYRLLAGVEGIPPLRAAFGDEGFVVDHVEAVTMARGLPAERLAAALDDLERVVARLHARRFVHLDLHQKRNVLVDARDRVWIVDLGQGLDCGRGLARLAFPLLRRIDRAAARKFRARYAPQTLHDAVRARYVTRYGRRRRRWWHEAARRLKGWLVRPPP